MPDTLAELIASNARVTWSCFECKGWGEVDLARLVAAKGEAFALTDRHPPCRTPGCTYWVRFYAQHGMRSQALVTAAGDARDSDRRSEWLSLRRAARPDATGRLG